MRTKSIGKAIIIVIIIITTTIILLTNVFCTLAICCPELLNGVFHEEIFSIASTEEQAVKMEASLLSNGLSILGIVIAVWTGISIANAIDTKRIDRIDKRIGDITSYIDGVELQQNKINRDIFITVLLSTSKDLATKKLIEFFENDELIKEVSFLRLIEVEELFRKVYEMHESKLEYNKLLREDAVRGINLTDNLLRKMQNDIVSTYLRYRKAEFKFYLGYCCTGEERFECFKDAIGIYEELYLNFEADVPSYENFEKYEEISVRKCTKKFKISAYFCNSLGEAYSKIVQEKETLVDGEHSKEELAEYGKKAIFYCKHACEWYNRETFWRNLGCALERYSGVNKENYDELYEVYNRAFELEATQSAFKVLLSLADKYFNRFLKINNVNVKKGRDIPMSDVIYKSTWDDLAQPTRNKLLEVLSLLLEKSNYAKRIYPSKEIGYIYSCIYNRDMCLISDKESDVFRNCLEKAKEDLEILKVISPSANLTKILLKDIDALTQRCE